MNVDFLCASATVAGAIFVVWYVWNLCWGVVPFTGSARKKKETKAVLSAARTFILSYEDLPDYREGGEFAQRLTELRHAWAQKDVPQCQSLLAYLDAPKSWATGREWLDILVVSISVAMAFRAYLYEPFNIPTGSMQPTLYGNHSIACAPEKATAWDKGPQKWLKWLMTGQTYECFKSPLSGYLEFRPTQTGHYEMRVVQPLMNEMGQIVSDRGQVIYKKMSPKMLVPTDVLHPTETGDGPYRGAMCLPNGLTMGSAVRKGQLLWSGYVATGDFLFVNRWLWNFRHPRRGDVMVFNTTGIAKLQQGTHYIKRMTAVPNETIEIKGGQLWIDGQIPMTPRRIAQIQQREKWHPAEPAFAGYLTTNHESYHQKGRTLTFETDQVHLGPEEFYACGDNSPSSYDSRYWGPVPAKQLVGIAGGVFWPFTHRWGPIE